MKRRLFTILSALSLVLCLACVGMWVRSGFWTDIVRRGDDGGRSFIAFVSSRGWLDLRADTWSPAVTGSRPGPWAWDALHGLVQDGVIWEWRWPSYASRTLALQNGGSVIKRGVYLPYWLLTGSSAVFPGSWCCLPRWQRWKAKRRQSAGLCRVCGYDLRASPERCPECGSAVSSPSGSA